MTERTDVNTSVTKGAIQIASLPNRAGMQKMVTAFITMPRLIAMALA